MSPEWIFLVSALLIIGLFLVSQQGRSVLRIFLLAEQRRKFYFPVLDGMVLITALCAFIFTTSSSSNKNSRNDSLTYIGRDYLLRLHEHRLISFDSGVSVQNISPEIAYIIPAIIRSIPVQKENKNLPVIVGVSTNSVSLVFPGSRSFYSKNSRIRKKLREKLGVHYQVQLNPQLKKVTIDYKGIPWHAEEILSLPVLEIALKENLDPVLLMAWVKAVSDFDLNFQNQKGNHGLLTLDSENFLDELHQGASLLRERLDLFSDIPTAFASIYLGMDRVRRNRPPWQNDPLARTWVEQILKNVKDYRKNGYNLFNINELE